MNGSANENEESGKRSDEKYGSANENKESGKRSDEKYGSANENEGSGKRSDGKYGSANGNEGNDQEQSQTISGKGKWKGQMQPIREQKIPHSK